MSMPLLRIICFASSLSIVFFLLLTGCSGLEQSEQEKIRAQNAKGEFIFRRANEQQFVYAAPEVREREKYPWEAAYLTELPKISREYFRCKGSSSHPPHFQEGSEKGEYDYDCGGGEKHSLPLHQDKEFIYPALIELLNYLQAKTGHRVVITCGHRCPAHNKYADPSPPNQTSKHMIGAEVDFYIQGMEERPEEIVKLIQNYYRETARFRGKHEYEQFERFEKSEGMETPPWYNKEITLLLHSKSEGRDFDNRHPYPYLTLQVRFDRDLNEKVTYSWPKAFKGYKRY